MSKRRFYIKCGECGAVLAQDDAWADDGVGEICRKCAIQRSIAYRGRNERLYHKKEAAARRSKRQRPMAGDVM